MSHFEAEIIDDGPQRGDSVQLLEANLLNDVRQARHILLRGINESVVEASLITSKARSRESVFVAEPSSHSPSYG